MEVENNIRWFSIPDDHFDLYGVLPDFTRIPAEIAQAVSDGVARQAISAAGGRLRFKTNSESVYIRTIVSNDRGVGYDIYRLHAGGEYFAAGFMSNNRPICEGLFESGRAVGKDGSMQAYTLNMPYVGHIEQLEVGISDRAELLPGAPYINDKPVIFYGSSIVHGRCATRPGTTYPAQISQKYNLHYLNMGFAGNAKGEQAMAAYLAGFSMIAFVCDYDHNAPDADFLEATHLPFYLTFREKNPDIPYIICTKPDYAKAPELSSQRAEVILRTYEYALAHGDRNVRFIDGKQLFNGDFYHNCTVDGTHPNDLGFYRIAAGIGDVVADVLGLEKKRHDYVEYQDCYQGGYK